MCSVCVCVCGNSLQAACCLGWYNTWNKKQLAVFALLQAEVCVCMLNNESTQVHLFILQV